MWIHDQIGTPAISFAKRHVFSGHDKAYYTLLAVTRTKFVANFRYSRLPRNHLDDARLLIVRGDNHAIDVYRFSAPETLLLRLPLDC